MNKNKLAVLTVVTLVVIVSAIMMNRHRAPTSNIEKQVLFQGLLDQVNTVDSVKLLKQGKELTLRRLDKQWVIQESDDYPANLGKIRETVIAVAELVILSEKTRNPERYPRLGVEDPATKGASSVLLTLADESGTHLAELIVGNARHSKSPTDKPGLYVRLPDSTEALLVEGRLELKPDAMEWFERKLFSIGGERIKRIQITHPDKSEVLLQREQDIDDFSIPVIPEGKELQSEIIISRMGTLLEDIFVDDVIKADKLSEHAITNTVVETFNGLTITIANADIDDKHYSSFMFEASDETAPEQMETVDADAKNETVSAEAERLNQLMSGWAYVIPSFKFELFTRTLDSLIRDAGSDIPTTETKSP